MGHLRAFENLIYQEMGNVCEEVKPTPSQNVDSQRTKKKNTPMMPSGYEG